MTGRFAFSVRGVRVQIDAAVLPCLAALLFADASVYTALVLLAAVLHEMGHIALLRWYRVRMTSVRICPFGAVIAADAARLPPKREANVCLAGVAVNLLLAGVFLPLGCGVGSTPLIFFGITNAVLGIVNLFPIPSLDGGSALRILLEEKLPPDTVQAACAIVGECALLLMTMLALMLLHSSAYNFSLLIFCAALFVSLCR